MYLLDKKRPRRDRGPEHASAGGERTRIEGREAWLLTALVTVGAALLCAWTLKIREFGIQTDELLYVKLASSIADTFSLLPVVHGESYAQPTPGYPVLLAPVVGLLPMPAAFVAAHALNAVLMASAAVPTYLLARAIGVTAGWALLSAALAIAVPWVTFSYYLTTESLAYPVMVWAVLAIHACVVRGGLRADAWAIAAIAVAILTRTQFVVLAGVLPVSVVVHAVLNRRSHGVSGALRSILHEHRLLFGIAALGVLGLGVAALGAGSRVVGNYHSLLEGDLMIRESLGAVPEHLTLLIVGASVVPFVIGAAWCLDALFRPSQPAAQAYAVVMGLTLPAVVLITAAFNERELGGVVQERYAFYVVPLVGVAFVAGLDQATRLRALAVVAAAVMVFAVLARFPGAAANAYSFVSPWHHVLSERSADLGNVVGIDRLKPLVFLRAATVAAAAAMLLCRRGGSWRRWSLAALAGFTLVFSAVQTIHVLDSNLTSVNDYAPGQGALVARDIDRGDRDWVDQAMPDGQRAAIVPGLVGGSGEARWLWWDVESWNKSVQRSYELTPGWIDTPFPHSTVRVDPATGRLSVDGEAPVRHLVLPARDRRVQVVGRTLELRSPMRLVEAEEPVRAAWWVEGADQDGWSAAGEPVRVHVFPAGARESRMARVRLKLTSAPPVAQRRRFHITGARPVEGILAPGEQVVVNARVCVPASRPAEVRVRIGGRTELPTGKLAGLAVTDVRVTRTRACDAT